MFCPECWIVPLGAFVPAELQSVSGAGSTMVVACRLGVLLLRLFVLPMSPVSGDGSSELRLSIPLGLTCFGRLTSCIRADRNASSLNGWFDAVGVVNILLDCPGAHRNLLVGIVLDMPGAGRMLTFVIEVVRSGPLVLNCRPGFARFVLFVPTAGSTVVRVGNGVTLPLHDRPGLFPVLLAVPGAVKVDLVVGLGTFSYELGIENIPLVVTMFDPGYVLTHMLILLNRLGLFAAYMLCLVLYMV